MAVILVAASPATSEEVYTDPAIALCERATRLGRSDEDKIISIVSSIEGADVIVTYRVSTLGTKPRERRNRCRFRLDPEINAFITAPIAMSVPTDCDARAEAFREREIAFFSPPQPPSADVEAAYKKAFASIGECTDAKSVNAFEIDRAEFLDREWRQTGIYPIKLEDTALRP